MRSAAAASGTPEAMVWPLYSSAIAPFNVTTVLTILVAGSFAQVWFAAGFPVATLCGQPQAAAAARLAMVGLYGACVMVIGDELSATLNAVCIGLATTGGSVLLWRWLHRAMGIETSALILLPDPEGVRWKRS